MGDICCKPRGFYAEAGAVHRRVSLRRKVSVVVGSHTDDVAIEMVRVLAERGSHVIFGTDDTEAVAEYLQDLQWDVRAARKKQHVKAIAVEIGSPDSVRDFVDRIEDRGLPVNLLLVVGEREAPNAYATYGETATEWVSATTLYGPALLTHLLLPSMRKTTSGCRIIFTVPEMPAQRAGSMTVESNGYSAKSAQKTVSTALTVFAREFNRQAVISGDLIRVNVAYPGNVDHFEPGLGCGARCAKTCCVFDLKTPMQGAATPTLLALAPIFAPSNDHGGRVFHNMLPAKGYEPLFGDDEAAAAVWTDVESAVMVAASLEDASEGYAGVFWPTAGTFGVGSSDNAGSSDGKGGKKKKKDKKKKSKVCDLFVGCRAVAAWV